MLGRIVSAVAVVGVVAQTVVWLRRPRAALPEAPILRSITIRASISEIEFFLQDEPSHDFLISLVPARALGTEVHVRAAVNLSRVETDRRVRTWLRRMKQLIETGEVARVDARVRGGELRA